MRGYPLVAADLFAVLASVFLVNLGVLAPLVNEEVLTYIEQTETQKKNDPGAPPAGESVRLTVTPTDKGHGKPRFRLVYPKGAPQSYGSLEALEEALKKDPPRDLRMRVDRRVLSGVFQDLLLITSRLGIRVWQQNAKQ